MNLEEINAELRTIERNHGCRILFAAESGSRAWGFPSPDSDYDIRFFYAHPLNWYLQLDNQKDTFQWFSGDLDFSGWDLRKALRLFAACNPSMNEQLGSPIVYESNGVFSQRIRELIPLYFNPVKAVHHYLGIAANFTEPVFRGEQVGIKKLFYILRPLLAGEWVAQFQTMPPTEFLRLLDETSFDAELRKHIDDLLIQKETAAEQSTIVVPPLIADWIRATCERLPKECERFPRQEKRGLEPLQQLFNEIGSCTIGDKPNLLMNTRATVR